jgi:hypothetical protein
MDLSSSEYCLISRRLQAISSAWLAKYFTLKMEAVCYSETSVNLYQATRRFTFQKDSNIHSHRSENLKFHVCWTSSYIKGGEFQD